MYGDTYTMTDSEMLDTLANMRERLTEERAENDGRHIGKERLAYARAAWKANPLPSAETLAAPIIAALRGVLDAFADRGEYLEFPLDSGKMRREARQAFAVADELAAILRTWVEMYAIPEPGVASAAVEALVRNLVSLQPAERAYYADVRADAEM